VYGSPLTTSLICLFFTANPFFTPARSQEKNQPDSAAPDHRWNVEFIILPGAGDQDKYEFKLKYLQKQMNGALAATLVPLNPASGGDGARGAPTCKELNCLKKDQRTQLDKFGLHSCSEFPRDL
jgi:hypothetical protein